MSPNTINGQETYEELYKRAWQQQIEASKKELQPETDISRVVEREIKDNEKENKRKKDQANGNS